MRQLQRFFSVAPLRSSIRIVQAVVERLSLSCRMLFEENRRTLASSIFLESQPSVLKQTLKQKT
jgi:hypothetical protein